MSIRTSIDNKLNLKYYKGTDDYSDGDIELELLKIVQENEDFSEVLKKDNRWAVLYHLTPLRRNLLEWYDFNKEADVLEIGAGLGAITGLLCEKNRSVTAVELSKIRASIIAERTKKYNNLEIFVGNLNDIKFDKKFDYITLIGVLEYAARYTQSENPYFDFLAGIKKLLKPNGTLIIAIENKFGLKYWAGANEDHTGRLFDSIENYPQNLGIKTFGKYELEQLIKSEGFSNLEFYYPMPDYKIPTQIFSDKCVPNFGQMNNFSNNYDQPRKILFNEKLAYANIIKNKQFSFFANSFLIFASNITSEKRNLYSNFKREIGLKYQIETDILEEQARKYSKKTPISKKSKEHISEIYENYKILCKQLDSCETFTIAPCKKIKNSIIFDYIEGENLSDTLQELILSQKREKIISFMQEYKKLIEKYYFKARKVEKYSTKKVADIFGEHDFENVFVYDMLNIDLIMDNIIKTKNKYTIIDYEFIINNSLPVDYIIARTVFNIYYKFCDVLSDVISKEEMFKTLDIKLEDAKKYYEMEKSFQRYVFKDANYTIGNQYQKAHLLLEENNHNNEERKLMELKFGKSIFKLTLTKEAV